MPCASGGVNFRAIVGQNPAHALCLSLAQPDILGPFCEFAQRFAAKSDVFRACF